MKKIKTILELIIKTEVNNCQNLSKIDVSDRNNFKKRRNMHLGFQSSLFWNKMQRQQFVNISKAAVDVNSNKVLLPK